MNHKRKRPKNARSGCLLCKPHKANGADRRTVQELRQPSMRELEAEYANLYNVLYWDFDWDVDDWGDWDYGNWGETDGVIEIAPGRFTLKETWPI